MHVEFGAGAVQVLFLEFHRKLGLVFLAPGSPKKILGTDVARIRPEDRLLADGEYRGEQKKGADCGELSGANSRSLDRKSPRALLGRPTSRGMTDF